MFSPRSLAATFGFTSPPPKQDCTIAIRKMNTVAFILIYATSTSLVIFAGASLNCAFTLATVFSTDRPYFLRSSSWVEACSMNLSGQPMRTTGVVTLEDHVLMGGYGS